jgi:cytochrome c oxidase subunit 2
MTSTRRNPKKPLPIRLLVVILSATVVDAFLSFQVSRWAYGWLPVPASTAAPYVDDLFSLEVGIGAFVFIGCVGFIIWSILFSRAEKYDESDGLPIEGNTKLEITWTVIPFVIVMALAFYSIHVNEKLASLGPKQKYDVAVNQSPDAVATLDARRDVGPIEVISRQWSWEFVYPDGVRSSELHLPLNQRANFLLISEDVLHSFYIPAFRLKQDIIPGSVISYSITPTREGRFRLRDAMFSGAYFSKNQTDVIVESEQDYSDWLKATASRPLVQGLSPGTALYEKRLKDGDRGWATVPPAPPPMVNDPGNPDAPHDA